MRTVEPDRPSIKLGSQTGFIAEFKDSTFKLYRPITGSEKDDDADSKRYIR